jgi:hypothetical protein
MYAPMSLQKATGSTVHVAAPVAPPVPFPCRVLLLLPFPSVQALNSDAEAAMDVRPARATALAAGTAGARIPPGSGGAVSG